MLKQEDLKDLSASHLDGREVGLDAALVVTESLMRSLMIETSRAGMWRGVATRLGAAMVLGWLIVLLDHFHITPFPNFFYAGVGVLCGMVGTAVSFAVRHRLYVKTLTPPVQS